MRKALFALFAAACVLIGVGQAIASDRQVIYPGENIGSSDWNLQARNVRISMGTWLLHALNLEGSVAGSGTYANLSLSPGTGLYVTVAPSAANTRGAIYQVVPVDALPMPSNAPAVVSPSPSPLPTDSSLIVVPALQLSTSPQIGPLTAPGSGLAVYWLIEAQISTSDVNVNTKLFQTSIGTLQSITVPTTRTDAIVYQAKSGTPAATPTIPTADAGWIGIGAVYVANGQSSITGGNITPSASFQGFAQSAPVIPCPSPGSNVTISGTDLPNCTINATISSGASFSGGVGVDSNTAPSNGFLCGNANTTPCQFKATTGTATTTGYTFDTTTACHGSTDSVFQIRVLGANKGVLNCSGGLALQNGIGLGGNTAPANGITCGVANTTPCQITATTGTSTTTGYTLNSTSGCHAATDTYMSVQVNGTQEWGVDCQGDTTATGNVNATGNVTGVNGTFSGTAKAATYDTNGGELTLKANGNTAIYTSGGFLHLGYNSHNVSVDGATITTGTGQQCGTPAGYHVECGNATVSSCAGGAQCNLNAITFTTAFSSAPFCVITPKLASGNAPVDGMVNTVSATGVTFTIYNGTGATITSPSEPYICIGV